MLWRRSYDIPPPPLDRRRRVRQLRRPALRRRCRRSCARATECLKDVVDRDAAVLVRRDRARTCGAGQTVLVAAHGNSLRALVKHLDEIGDAEIVGLNIPTGIPLRLRARRRLHARSARAAATSTRRPRRPPSRRSRTRARRSRGVPDAEVLVPAVPRSRLGPDSSRGTRR